MTLLHPMGNQLTHLVGSNAATYAHQNPTHLEYITQLLPWGNSFATQAISIPLPPNPMQLLGQLGGVRGVER
jgi:hypothetical protein